MLLAIAIAATILAFIQNSVMFAFGMKELAILSFPSSFAGIFLIELAVIWTAYFLLRKRTLRLKMPIFAACSVLILGVAEFALPVSYVKVRIRHARREKVLNQIQVLSHSIEPLKSDQGGIRFALTYTLSFPRTASFHTFPAWLGEAQSGIFGNYFSKVTPEYFDESYVFKAGQPYSFTVVFDTKDNHIDFSRDQAHIDICDGKDYFMACRMIPIRIQEVPAAFSSSSPPIRYEPEVPSGNVEDITERSIRLDGLRLNSAVVPAGQSVPFSFAITNIGNQPIAIPGGNLANVIRVVYTFEPVSERAKKTEAVTTRIGNGFAAGGTQFYSIRTNNLAPRQRLPISDKIAPFKPFAPGDYRLHVYLFSSYATDQNRPGQELVEPFTVEP
ncbi:MAG TPA: hypothetical protein VGR47_05610 [Terracidiphilus sp.]|nr:hypothetical protein [Terracidiphilus sp.]